jgi:hypothetical protein
MGNPMRSTSWGSIRRFRRFRDYKPVVKMIGPSQSPARRWQYTIPTPGTFAS